MPTSKDNYYQKLAGQAVTVLLTIIISMTGFWMMIGRNFATRDEVNTAVENRIHVVEAQIKSAEDSDKKVQEVIEKNTEAIQGLQVQIAVLNKTLELIRKDDEKN